MLLSTRAHINTNTQLTNAQFSLAQSLCLRLLSWSLSVNFLPINLLSSSFLSSSLLSSRLVSSPLLSSPSVFIVAEFDRMTLGLFPPHLWELTPSRPPSCLQLIVTVRVLWDACLKLGARRTGDAAQLPSLTLLAIMTVSHYRICNFLKLATNKT